MSGKRKLALLMVLILICCSAACKRQEKEEQKENDSVIQIDPNEGAINTNSQNVMLYFANEDYTMLVGKPTEISVPVSSRVEYSILEALIYGPQTIGADFNAVINPQTKIVNIEESQDYISITFSEDFLDWSFITVANLSAEAMNHIKKLSVYAVVNSIVEASICKKVQILVDNEGSKTGQRITLSEVGMGGSGILEPLGRSGNLVLSAENTLVNIFEAIKAEDYSELYRYIAYTDEEDNQRPLENTFSVWMQSKNIGIEDYQIVEIVETVDQQSAILMANYTMNISGEGRKEMNNTPIKLIRENGIWKITYAMVEALF
ncbi:MAG: hypothetical protein DBY39_07555 [Clostridiales bacterium]|nr:MAG: hypothetical protein DBY39_07555 [Clostridiales bacterium]